MGQSAGNHVLGQALADGCMYAKAFVMIDPVDGLDPYGIVKSEDLITPGTKVNFTIPSLILDNGLDPQKAFSLFPACMPIIWVAHGGTTHGMVPSGTSTPQRTATSIA